MAFNLGRSDGDKQKTYLIDYKIYSNKSQKLWGCEDASYIHDDATCSRLAIAADSIPVTQNDLSLPVECRLRVFMCFFSVVAMSLRARRSRLPNHVRLRINLNFFDYFNILISKIIFLK